MKVIKIYALVLALCFTGISNGSAQGVETDAEFAIIMDHQTGEILFEKNARVPTAPASMSKLMTTAILFERLRNGSLSINDTFSVSEKAWRERGGSTMWVRVDTEIPVIDLLRGIIVQSGNDACIVVAENISGSVEAFADLMNQKAREWGMTDSTFANPHGLPDPNQKMSMRDLALLTRLIIKDYNDLYPLFAEREFTWEQIRQENRNPLLDTFDGADGLKTGHTEESGYGLVGSAERGGIRRIVVVNGLESARARSNEATRLLRVAFNDFTRKTFYSAGDIVGNAAVFKGKQKTAPLTVRENVSMIVHRASLDAVNAKVIYEGPVLAPIRKDQQIGYLQLSLDGGETKEFPLFAESGVRELSAFGKIGLAAKALLAKPERPPESELSQ